jgi:hypothetical protein
MAQSREDLIAQLCDAWLAAVYQPDGRMLIGASENFRLHQNGIQFHELSYAEMQASCVGLTRVLLLKNLNSVLDLDHQLFWAWSAELIVSVRSGFFTPQEMSISQLFDACIRASLAGIRPPLSSSSPSSLSSKLEEWRQERWLAQLVEFNTRQLVTHNALILAYLSFPLLEAMVKKVCSAYVDYSGTVLSQFTVPTRGGGRTYRPDHPREGTCSSLRDLLHLLYSTVADADLHVQLEKFRQHIQTLDTTIDPFDLIYAWRNQSLHGQSSFPTIGGTVLNLTFLIALNQIQPTYEERRDRAWQRIQHNRSITRSTGVEDPSRYYPPW